MVTIEWYEGPRAALGDLFALADDSLAAVRAYRDSGAYWWRATARL